jgi:Putative zinc-finger
VLKRILGHLISCRQATRLVSQLQERDLHGVERVLLRLHLAWCVACARFDAQMHFLRQAMQRYRE